MTDHVSETNVLSMEKTSVGSSHYLQCYEREGQKADKVLGQQK